MEQEECDSDELNSQELEKSNVKKEESRSRVTEQVSESTLNALIFWNISKALERNPSINLKSAIRAAQDRLERVPQDVNSIISDDPEKKYLGCAVLAWLQLGNDNADNLYEFIEKKRKERVAKKAPLSFVCTEKSSNIYPGPSTLTRSKITQPKENESTESYFSTRNDFGNVDSYSVINPALKLPVAAKLVMRVQNKGCTGPPKKPAKSPQKEDVMKKIDAACCMDSACTERLQAMDVSIAELRMRAGRLARREAERVELLERAEAAWRDLEMGYQRRHNMAIEKEEDITNQMQKMVDERNSFKEGGTKLAQQLKEKGQMAEAGRARLMQIEKEICDRACTRHRLYDECARIDAIVADCQCKEAQLERDLQFKEDQVRRKMVSMESEAEAARSLTHEAERTLRGELGSLREQVELVSAELLEEDERNGHLKKELEQLQQEKSELGEDQEACKVMCEGRMQDKLDELKKKRDRMVELKQTVTECRCKLPIDESVEVKRTVSLVALCRCSDERIPENCSCTSLRGRLISNVMSDLFGGLQSELGVCIEQMPCQLLKCLEDKHNWERTTDIKTHLVNYFSKLLTGELDIAIATSIEKYHATWVGASCADADGRILPDCRGRNTDSDNGLPDAYWQNQECEVRAQNLATHLAEQLFNEQENTQKCQKSTDNSKRSTPKSIVSPEKTSCDCCQPESTVYQCMVKPTKLAGGVSKKVGTKMAYSNWQQAINDVTQLKTQIQDLKKEIIKKEDLKGMEEKINKMIKRSSVPENVKNININKLVAENKKENLKDRGITKRISNDPQIIARSRLRNKVPSSAIGSTEHARKAKKIGQTFAINMCFCTNENPPENKKMQINRVTSQNKNKICHENSINITKKRINAIKDNEANKLVVQAICWKEKPNVKQTKPILKIVSDHSFLESKHSEQKCVCFQRAPSTASLDNYLKQLIIWQNLSPLKKNQFLKSQELRPETKFIYDDKKIEQEKQNLNKNKEIGVLTSENNLRKKFSTKFTTCDFLLPADALSDYIGEVYLDKSFENEIKNKTKKYDKPVSSNHNFRNDYFKLCNENETADLNKTTALHLSQKSSDQQEDNVTPLSLSECDYDIKFLGVTLTDANREPPLETNYRCSGMITVNNVRTDSISLSKSIGKSDIVGNLQYPLSKSSSILINMHNKSATTTSSPKKDFENNIKLLLEDYCSKSSNMKTRKSKISKVMDIYNANKLGKSIQVPSSSPQLNSNEVQITEKKNVCDKDVSSGTLSKNKESCVCCKSVPHDDIRELEINTFHLLEQCLREKLGKSAILRNLQPDKENNILVDLLQKIKQVISENIQEISCKCEENETVGNWNRAYILLQEYLKYKINRGYCSCFPKEDETHFPTMPTVLQKVCSLIKNDFQRLETISKVEESNNNKTDEKMISVQKKSLDNIRSKSFTLENKSQEISKQTLNYLICQNISIQVIPQLNMKSISCDVLPKSTQIIQTDETKQSTVEVNNSSGVNQDRPATKLVSYIGQTIECTCGQQVGACVCTKSVVETNPNQIDNIWKELTTRYHKIRNSSYILSKINPTTFNSNIGMNTSENSIPRIDYVNNVWKDFDSQRAVHKASGAGAVNKKSERINTLTLEELKTEKMYETKCQIVKSKNKRNCESDCKVVDNKEIVLKESLKNIKRVNNTTNTIFCQEMSGMSTEDPLEYYRETLKYQKSTSQNTIEDVSDYDSTTLSERNIRESGSCDCNVVPICHVKMLIENIEKRLEESKCTCDSLSSNVCPIHSKVDLI